MKTWIIISLAYYLNKFKQDYLLMKAILLLQLLIFSPLFIIGQTYSKKELNLASNYIKDSIQCELLLPETFPYASETTKYPVMIIFDSQHENIYPQIINGIELLKNESQIPEHLIVGIPLNRAIRYHLTSTSTINDTISGIEKMSNFLFEELLPLLKKEYKSNDFLILAGHSRTSFLVNYLLVHHPTAIDVAIATSGFFGKSLIGVEGMQQFLADSTNFSLPIRYYFTAGSTNEEQVYLQEYQALYDFLQQKELSKNLSYHFKINPNANHMTNYWVSIPPILIDVYADYNKLLNSWFEYKLKDETLDDPVEEFRKDIQRLETDFNSSINPSFTQIFSLMSHYAFQKEDYNIAIEFLKFGLEYYPNYYEFDELIGEFYGKLGNEEKRKNWESSSKQKKKQIQSID